MSKRWQDYTCYEFIGGSRDGELGDLNELGYELREGDEWAVPHFKEHAGLGEIPDLNERPYYLEIYRVVGHKLIFKRYK